jgi:hypothetical protein
LIEEAAETRIGGHVVKVAALSDIIRSNSAAVRELEELRRRRAEQGLTEP